MTLAFTILLFTELIVKLCFCKESKINLREVKLQWHQNKLLSDLWTSLCSHSAWLVSLPVWSYGKVRQYLLFAGLRVMGHPITASGLEPNPLRSHQLSNVKLPWGAIDPIDPLAFIRAKLQWAAEFNQCSFCGLILMFLDWSFQKKTLCAFIQSLWIFTSCWRLHGIKNSWI